MNVLIIGCGNIGALYDLETDEIKTHCKALSKMQMRTITVYDENTTLAKNISEKYSFNFIQHKKEIELKNYQLITIASPTNTHYLWLKECFSAKVPLVICEKPISKKKAELLELEKLYNNGSTKVIINYIRRFQPEYYELKENILSNNSIPLSIIIKYHRGLVNNFSHAADLLCYIFGEYSFDKTDITQKVFDEFDDDPTISFTATYNEIPVSVVGLINTGYSYFEIEMFFRDKKILIHDAGNKITYYTATVNEISYQPLVMQLTKADILSNYMTYVYEYAQKVYENRQPDNFTASLNMNQQLLQIIQ